MRGLPYRRGYLLHGIPGSGKSSLVLAVATELSLPVYLLNLSPKLSDEALVQLLEEIKERCVLVLLIEDIDRANTVTHADQPPAQKNDHRDVMNSPVCPELTLAGLLNAIDGPTASTGRLFFMTTNHRQALPCELGHGPMSKL